MSLTGAEDMYERVVGSRTVKLVFWKAQISEEFIHNSANSTEPFEPWFSTLATQGIIWGAPPTQASVLLLHSPSVFHN